jgi:hypothetical protein
MGRILQDYIIEGEGLWVDDHDEEIHELPKKGSIVQCIKHGRYYQVTDIFFDLSEPDVVCDTFPFCYLELICGKDGRELPKRFYSKNHNKEDEYNESIVNLRVRHKLPNITSKHLYKSSAKPRKHRYELKKEDIIDILVKESYSPELLEKTIKRFKNVSLQKMIKHELIDRGPLVSINDHISLYQCKEDPNSWTFLMWIFFITKYRLLTDGIGYQNYKRFLHECKKDLKKTGAILSFHVYMLNGLGSKNLKGIVEYYAGKCAKSLIGRRIYSVRTNYRPAPPKKTP